MEAEKIKVVFRAGYAGKPKIEVYVGGDDMNGLTVGEIESRNLQHPKEYTMDTDYIETLLEKMIEEKGYTISQSKRQHYPRLIINE